MHLQFCGAANEVTGSCTKLTVAGTAIIVDCGLFQGGRYVEEKNYYPFPFEAEEIDAVVMTHAHLDHCGRLPKLVNQGFMGKIYATAATRDLIALILIDSAEIMAEEAAHHGHPPLFTPEDIPETIERFTPLPYDTPTRIAPGVTINLGNAGHVLGSSFIEIRGDGKTVIFSGDVGNYPVPILPQPEDLPCATALVLESTYGDRAHSDYAQGRAILEQAIRETIRDQGVLLIPAFSLERTQELLALIDEALEAHRIPKISAYLDSPLATKINRVYEKYQALYSRRAREIIRQEADHSLLTFPNLTVTERAAQSKMINEVSPPKLVIAGSGMMQGGRILHHLKRYLPFENTRLLIVGHQVEGSLGRRLLEGERVVVIHGEKVEVNARIITTHAFSSHMDRDQLLKWVGAMKPAPRLIFLNHGDSEARSALGAAIEQTIKAKVYLPRLNDGWNLDEPAVVAPSLQPAPHRAS